MSRGKAKIDDGLLEVLLQTLDGGGVTISETRDQRAAEFQ